MNTNEAREYLVKSHGVNVQTTTITKWLKTGIVKGIKTTRWEVSEQDIDAAIESKQIPRTSGRPSGITKEQKQQMRDMFDKKGWSQKGIANHFNISESYVSLILHGLR